MYITFLFSISKNLSLVKTFVFLISAYRFQQLLCIQWFGKMCVHPTVSAGCNII